MLQCECLSDCALYSDAMVTMPGIANIFRGKYCVGNQMTCARYKAYQALGEGNVPADLYPHQHAKLKDLIA
ncbi:MAG TPA: hypothetical protein VGK50_02800 [Coriobacteriia bacterium]